MAKDVNGLGPLPNYDADTVLTALNASLSKAPKRITAEQLAVRDGDVAKRLAKLYADKDTAGAEMLGVLLEAADMLRQMRNTDGLSTRITRAIVKAKTAGFSWQS